MRGVPILAALGLCLGAGVVRAGVYNTAEAESPLSDRFDVFRSTLIALKQIGIAPEDAGPAAPEQPFHKRYTLVGELCSRGTPPNLTVEQRLQVSAYLIRLRKYREAVAVLALAERPGFPERDNFLVFSNLATAQFLAGQAGDRDLSRRAGENLSEALYQWKPAWKDLSKDQRKWIEAIGWNESQFVRYRKAEESLRKLFRLRARESRPPANPTELLGKEIEALFDDGGKPPRPVRFVGESGKYEAGKLARAEQAKLPPDALPIVQQLLVWLPDDLRLYWLYGELLNARGEFASALEVFTEVNQKLNSFDKPGLDPFTKKSPKRDPRFLKGPFPPPVNRDEDFSRLPLLHKEHLLALRAAKKAAKDAFEREVQTQPANPQSPAVTKPPPPPPSAVKGALPIDFRSLAVGFAFGLLMAFFGYWQLREIRRRLQGRVAPSQG